MRAPARRIALLSLFAAVVACSTSVKLPFGVARPETLAAQSVAGGIEVTWSPPAAFTLAWGSAGGPVQSTAVSGTAHLVSLAGTGEYTLVLSGASDTSGALRVHARPGPAAPFRPGPDIRLGSFYSSGYSVAAADVDRDGFGDVVVSAPYSPGTNEGQVQYFSGGPAGVASNDSFTWVGPQPQELAGCSVALGDQDDDGFPELFIGARLYDQTVNDDSGALFIEQNTQLEPPFSAPIALEAPKAVGAAGDHLGEKLAAFDIVGSGGVEGVVGEPAAPGGAGSGKIVIFGGAGSFSGGSGDLLGGGGLVPLRSAGPNVMLAGAPGHAGFGSVKVLVIRDTSTLSGEVTGTLPDGAFGKAIVSLGAGADGLERFAISSPGAVVTTSGVGMVQLFRWETSLVAESWSYTAENGFGSALAAGDVNGDGRKDLIVGSPRGSRVGDLLQAGLVYVFLGTENGLEPDPVFVTAGYQVKDELGRSLAVTDIDGDGLDDLIAGAPALYAAKPGTASVFLAVRSRGPRLTPPLPIVAAPATQTLVEVKLEDPIPGAPHSCAWDFDDGTPPLVVDSCGDPSVSHAWESAGGYHPTVLVTATDGRAGMAALTVNVQ